MIDISRLRKISVEAAKKDYVNLQKSKGPRSGLRATDIFFFTHRLRCKTHDGISFHDWLEKELYKKPYAERLIKHKMSKKKSYETALYETFQLLTRSGSINQMRPMIAKQLYEEYKPTTVLDFSAGWGGRCLAAMACNIHYIGYDTNTALESAYNKLVETYKPSSKVSMYYSDSAKADFSKHEYDFVFTSPPYFTKSKPTEIYEGMPDWTTKEQYLSEFLMPVIRNAWKHLKANGHLAINVPNETFERIKTVLGEPTKVHPLKAVKRSSKYTESIYVWKKGAGLPPPTFTSNLIEVKPSTVHGLGAFAKVNLKKGQRLCSYIGDFMTKKEFKKMYTDTHQTYSLRSNILVGKNYLTQNPIHYMNEAKTPNVFLKCRGAHALRDIVAGEELFLSYPKDYLRDYSLSS